MIDKKYPISSEVLELQKESVELAREKQAREILQALEDEGQEITKWYISNNQHLVYFLEWQKSKFSTILD